MQPAAAGGADLQRADRSEAAGAAAGVAHGTAQATTFSYLQYSREISASRAPYPAAIGVDLATLFQLAGRVALAAFAWLTRDSREQILHLQRLGRTISSPARFLHSRDAPYACPTPFSHLVFPTSLSASWPVCPRPFESLRTDYGMMQNSHSSCILKHNGR